jgi:hypothetical protein
LGGQRRSHYRCDHATQSRQRGALRCRCSRRLGAAQYRLARAVTLVDTQTAIRRRHSAPHQHGSGRRPSHPAGRTLRLSGHAVPCNAWGHERRDGHQGSLPSHGCNVGGDGR